jgi:cobalamin synthase
MARSARALVLALQYFTRIPIPAALARWAGFDAALQRASLAHFPAVGVLVASVASFCYWLADARCTRTGWPTQPTASAAAPTASARWTS